MEIRNVDTGKQAFCGKGGYTCTTLHVLWARLGYRKKWDKFLQKKAENNKLILDN